jgi:hypothetical protein
MNDLVEIYKKLGQLPFPVLGKEVGDFVLYDSLLAGCADRLCPGATINASEVPAPDTTSQKHASRLRHKDTLSTDERLFIEYLDLLERLRLAVLKRLA